MLITPSLAFADLGYPPTGYKTMLRFIDTNQYQAYFGPGRMILDILNQNGLAMVTCYYSLDGTSLDYTNLNKRNIPAAYSLNMFRNVYVGNPTVESSSDGNYYILSGTFGNQNNPFIGYATKEGMEWMIQHPNWEKDLLSRLPQGNEPVTAN